MKMRGPFKTFDVEKVEYTGELPSAVEQRISNALRPQEYANEPGKHKETIGLDVGTEVRINVGGANTSHSGITVSIVGPKSSEWYEQIAFFVISEIDYPTGEDREVEYLGSDEEPETVPILRWKPEQRNVPEYEGEKYEFSFTVRHSVLYSDYQAVSVELLDGEETLLVPPEVAEDDEAVEDIVHDWWYSLDNYEQKRRLPSLAEDAVVSVSAEH